MTKTDLYLPALRCLMGDWHYYITCLSFTEIASRIRPADEIHKSESLNELIQRELSDRSKKIANYLLSQEQRFFNSIVVGVYGGNPEWLDIRLMSTIHLQVEQLDEETVEYIGRTLGLLRLTGQEKLFAMDGQHRVEAIRQALASRKSLGDEEVSVIFVGHDRSDEGLKRTRRLFSTLNKYAKPVSKGEIVALDEDDAFAIATRRIVDEHPLFKGRRANPGKPEKQTRITRSDKRSFTSILTIYDIAMVLSEKKFPHWTKAFLTVEKPPDEIIDQIYEQSVEFWDALIANFLPIKELVDSDPETEIAGKYRTEDGGHVLFRPIGQMAFARAIRLLANNDIAIGEAAHRLASLPYDLAEPPWINILWNPVSKQMLTNAGNRDVAAKLMFYYAGYSVDQVALLNAYRTVVRDAEAKLPIINNRYS